MVQKEIYIITGGPSSGKSLLIDELQKIGYSCSGEFARELIEEQRNCNGEILPEKNSKLFQHEILSRRISFFQKVPENTVAFADRGIPDQIAFAKLKCFNTPEILTESAENYRYASNVFVCPPWQDIYCNDIVRLETFEEAVEIYHSVLETYCDLNYKIIELPLLSVNERINIIMQTISKTQ